MKEVKIFTVSYRGCDIFCKRRGAGPLMLLIHGVAVDSSYYEEAADILAQHYTVITYDRRGYSRSVCSEEGTAYYGAADQAGDAKAILDYVSEGPAIVVGSSAGGIVALELRRRFPESVTKLVLYEAAWAVTKEDREKLNDWRKQMLDAAARRRKTTAFLSFIRAIGGVDPEAKELPLEQQGRNIKNFEIFLAYEIRDFLSFGERVDNTDVYHLPDVIGTGEYDLDGMIRTFAFHQAERSDAVFSVAGGYHNFPEERPQVFALWLQENLKASEHGSPD